MIPPAAVHRSLRRGGFAALLDRLRDLGYRLVGPTVRGGAIVHDELRGIEDLPAGWTETQEAGRYRLRRRDDEALFGFSAGPQSWKKFFFAPRIRLFQVRREGQEISFTREAGEYPRLALVGARSCDVHAIEIQDRTFLQGQFVDEDYASRRMETFVIAVQCGQAGGTCFCVSMNTGPRVTFGYDIVLTEIVEGEHRFVVNAASDRGEGVLRDLPAASFSPSSEGDGLLSDQIVERTASSMGRVMDTTDIKGLLYRNPEHPRWDEVAHRCLACTNCTLVCPTCFCSTVEDVSDLAGEMAERWRQWDSCFTLGHSYLHGGSVRQTIRSRYRQWLTHKVASWFDQFDTSGCVGCGRCITWCPVGIDITEEVAAIRSSDGAGSNG